MKTIAETRELVNDMKKIWEGQMPAVCIIPPDEVFFRWTDHHRDDCIEAVRKASRKMKRNVWIAEQTGETIQPFSADKYVSSMLGFLRDERTVREKRALQTELRRQAKGRTL
jgi:hypothetical protein